MAEPIVINAETREITVPESERSFGVAGEHNVARKHFRINGRIVDGNDLAVGFAWKVCTENSAKQPNEYPIDSIIADSDGIEFDWLVGKGALPYKGSLKFAVCAKQSVKRSTGTLEIIQTCSREKFLVCSPESSLLTIVEEEVVTQNFLFFDTGIL